jgi:hypothetical protein
MQQGVRSTEHVARIKAHGASSNWQAASSKYFRKHACSAMRAWHVVCHNKESPLYSASALLQAMAEDHLAVGCSDGTVLLIWYLPGGQTESVQARCVCRFLPAPE